MLTFARKNIDIILMIDVRKVLSLQYTSKLESFYFILPLQNVYPVGEFHASALIPREIVETIGQLGTHTGLPHMASIFCMILRFFNGQLERLSKSQLIHS